MTKLIKFCMAVSIFFLLSVTISSAQYLCNWNTLSSGGGTIASPNYRTQSTIGQTAIGNLTSSNIFAYIGFWYPLPIIGITEQRDDEMSDINPLITKLYSAKPNPFQSHTTIRYSLSAETKTSLMIYDINGRLVKTLLDETKQPGIYTINWNGTNEHGQKVSSGIYFYKLQNTNYSLTRKILLIE